MNTLRRKVRETAFNAYDKRAIFAFLYLCNEECREIASEINHPKNGQFDAIPSEAVKSVIFRMSDSLLEGDD